MNNTEAFVISLFMQAILYGVYLVTLAHCLRWLLYADEGWKLRSRVNWLAVTVPIVVFVLLTADVGLALQINLYNAQDAKTPHLLFGARCFVEIAANLIVDAALIYRCWIVYSKSRTIIYLPVLLWLGALTLFIHITYLSLDDAPNPEILPARNTIFIVYYSCNIVITIYGTSAIIYRIKSVTGSSFSATCRILAESGLLYTVSSIIVSMTTVFGKGTKLPIFLACALNSCTTGIAFNLIQIRVGQHRADGFARNACHVSGTRSSLRFSAPHHTTEDIGSSPENAIYETKSMQNSQASV